MWVLLPLPLWVLLWVFVIVFLLMMRLDACLYDSTFTRGRRHLDCWMDKFSLLGRLTPIAVFFTPLL